MRVTYYYFRYRTVALSEHAESQPPTARLRPGRTAARQNLRGVLRAAEQPEHHQAGQRTTRQTDHRHAVALHTQAGPAGLDREPAAEDARLPENRDSIGGGIAPHR